MLIDTLETKMLPTLFCSRRELSPIKDNNKVYKLDIFRCHIFLDAICAVITYAEFNLWQNHNVSHLHHPAILPHRRPILTLFHSQCLSTLLQYASGV